MRFKEILKAELDYRGILVKELAITCGISRRTIDNYLRNKESQPTAENAVKIAKALNVSVEYLVTGSESSAKSPQTDIDITLCKKHYNLIQKIDKLSPESIKQIESLTDYMR